MTKKSIVYTIPNLVKGIFIERPNRFVAIVEIKENGIKRFETVHVHDPGRLTSILYPKSNVLLKEADNPKRKTKWDLIASSVEGDWILINSTFHRQISDWVLKNRVIDFLNEIETILPEQKYGDSRLDYLLLIKGKKIWVEVKGCTLAEEKIALFPDAPTMRGNRHLNELIKAKRSGDEAVLLILVLVPKVKCFAPNKKIDPLFTDSFNKSLHVGVNIFPLLFSFENGNIYYESQLQICDNAMNIV